MYTEHRLSEEAWAHQDIQVSPSPEMCVPGDGYATYAQLKGHITVDDGKDPKANISLLHNYDHAKHWGKRGWET